MGPRGYLFRAIVLATLLIVASIFSIATDQEVRSPQAEKRAAEQATKIEAPKSFGAKLLDDPTAFFTMALAALTAVLAATAAGQIYYLHRTDETARKTADAAMKAATAAERTIDAAEAPFLLPTITKDTILATADGFIAEVGLGQMIEFEFRNIGRTPALLLDVCSSPYFMLGLPEPLDDLLLHTGLLKTEVIAPNDKSKTYGYGLNDGLHAYFFGGRLGRGHNEILSVQIHARYADLYGSEFIGRFCFIYAGGRGDWSCIGGAEYNYRRKVKWPAPISARERLRATPLDP